MHGSPTPMKRDLQNLVGSTWDLLVVGGGIYGAWAAWDATLRGLSVALIDQADFGGGTSANSLKIVHGGLRYLQQADFRRMRQSIRERSTLARVASHLVRPMPFLVATRHSLVHSKAAFRLAFGVTDLVGFDRNSHLPPEARIPSGRTVSLDECVRLFPGFGCTGSTGGAVWWDYQLHNSERLPLSILLSASDAGAQVANYVRAERLLIQGDHVVGVQARDLIGGEDLEIRARMVLSAMGPWIGTLAATSAQTPAARLPTALAVNLVARRPPAEAAVAVRTRTTPADDPVGGGNRFLFLTPWRGSTVVGTAYYLNEDIGGGVELREQHLQSLVDECNRACPDMNLTLDEVTFFHAGRLPLKAGREPGRATALAQRARVIDHQKKNGIGGMISVEGVKYTTARLVAEKATDLVLQKLGRAPAVCRTADVRIRGADPLSSADESALAPGVTQRLHEAYGSDAPRVLTTIDEAEAGGQPIIPGATLLRGEVIHAIQHEMAVTLNDVVFRRTGAGTERRPSDDLLAGLADLCGSELGWGASRRADEVREVLHAYSPLRCLTHHSR
jgi:glycerol-3-phosphate dehydrogenase